MFGTALIVFREVLEAALIVGIVAAATKGIPGRDRWIGAGLIAGILGSIAVAFAAEGISTLAEGMGQELFNATILGIAVVMLARHNIWMSVHGREMAADAKRIGGDIQSRSEEYTSELQSRRDLVCRLLLEKKKKHNYNNTLNGTKNQNTAQRKHKNDT